MAIQKVTGGILKTTGGLARACCCAAECPTSCGSCSTSYTLNAPAGGVCCLGMMGQVFQITYAAFSVLLTPNGTCIWTNLSWTLNYHLKVYSSGTCDNPVGSPIYDGDGSVPGTAGVICSGAQWTCSIAWNALPCAPGNDQVGRKAASACPDGTYTNSFSIS